MKFKCAVFLLLLAGILCVPGLSALDGVCVGIGPEANALTREGAAVGGNLSICLDFNQHIAAGVNVGFFNDLDTLSSLKILGFFRYFIPVAETASGPFIQADGGYLILLENDESYPSFAGGLSAGWRFVFAESWFLEPVFSFGFPYMWGGSLIFGIRFR